MTAKEAIKRLCALVTEVGHTVFHSQEMHDCFCEEQASWAKNQRVSEKVIAFIERAVQVAVMRTEDLTTISPCDIKAP